MTKILIVLGSRSKLDCREIRKVLRPLKLGRNLRIARIADMAKGAVCMERTAREIAEYAYTRCTPDLCIGIWGGDLPLLCPNGELSEPTHHELAYVIQLGEEFAGTILSPCDGTGTYLPAEDPLSEAPPPENALSALTELVQALCAEIALQAPHGQSQMQ